MNTNTNMDSVKKLLMANVINLMTVACVDGEISPEEQTLINNIAHSYGLTEDEFNFCSEKCNECIKQGTVVIETPEAPEARVEFLKNLVMLMMSDGKISDSEVEYIEFMAGKYGFKPKETVEALIDDVYKEFSEQGGESDIDDEALQKEIQKAVSLGKEALTKDDVPAAFDYLFKAAHLDKEAFRLFLMIPEIEKRLFRLTEEQVEALEDAAGKGSALAQYTLGRYHQVVQPDGESLEKARDLFISSGKAGMGDPLAALAQMMIHGQLDSVDVDEERYYQGMQEAWDKGSMVGVYHVYKGAIMGTSSHEAVPQEVIDNIKQWLKGDESEDILKVNPTYYEVLAAAYEQLDDWDTAAEYYLKCVRMGRYDLHYQWVLNTFIEKNYEITDEEGYQKAIEEGVALGCPYSYVLRAYLNEQRYEASEDEKEKEALSRMIGEDFYTAGSLGEGVGYYNLGLLNYQSLYGYNEDDNAAWGYFLDASGMNVAEAWGMMGDMYLEEKAPADLGPHFISYCRLMGLRLGDDSMLIPVIISYYGGYLDQYEEEVQKYYLPRYNALTDEEKTEYFGLEFIAAVKTSGQANLIQFDFETEEWSELEEIIDAKRLEAIHTPQLDKISKELELGARLTAWVDSDRVAKKLEPNALGSKFSSSPILGDIVFTLEDDEYHPMTLGLAKFKEVVATLGGEVEDVYYDEFPDDDSHVDPHA